MEMYAGEKATRVYGSDVWLPDETLEAARDFSVSIKGPLTTPVGGGIRSLNVALRQQLDLYVCLRPVRWFPGVPSPLRDPSKTDMVIFRENSEDIYAGIEWEAGTDAARKVIAFLQDEMDVRKIRFPETSSIGVKPVSQEGTERLVRKAIEYALANGRDSVTLVHKGNIMKFTEGGFRDWGYALAAREFGATPIDGGPWLSLEHEGRTITIKDAIADAFLQQILLRPGRVRRDRDAEPERRLHLGRARRAGGRDRDRARREHVRRRGDVRGHARHGAEVRGPGQGQPRLADPLRRDDAAPPGLGRGRRPDHRRRSAPRSPTRSSPTTSRGCSTTRPRSPARPSARR